MRVKFNWLIIPAVLIAMCGGEDLLGQTVQLPSIRQFSYRGSVLVPDGGSTYLGGNRSSAMRRSSAGLPLLPNLPGDRFDSQAAAGGISASVTIIDLEEMDRQILGDRWRESIKRATSESPGTTQMIAEAKSLVRNARRAWQSGKVDSARDTYELAIESLTRLAANEAPSGKENANSRGSARHLLAFARAEYTRLFPDQASGLVVRP